MNDSSQDPVYVEDPINVNIEGQCTLNDHKPESEKIVTIKGTKSISLESLSVEDVCYLLDHCQLSAITTVARENQFSGNILATGVESADNLKEFGLKSMFAQSLFKHIVMWKTNGVPADIFAQRDAAVPVPVPAQLSPTRGMTVGATNIGAGVHLRVQRRPSQDERSTRESLPPTPPILHSQPQNTIYRSNTAQHRPTSSQSPVNAVDSRKHQEYVERESERLRQQHEANTQARETEIRELTTALRALETDMHRGSARMVLGLGGRYDVQRCCLCECARPNDPKPSGWCEDKCKHNNELVNKVLNLPGVFVKRYEYEHMNYPTFTERYNAVLKLGKNRLKELQG